MLSRDTIIETALRIIDADGASAMSMRRLGAELGVDPMAVYYHVPNKSALFDGIVEAVYREVDTAAIAAVGPWRDRLAEAMYRLRAALRDHPNAMPIIATRPTCSVAVWRIVDLGMQALRSAGLPSDRALDMVMCLTTYTVGHVLAEIGEPLGEHVPGAEELFATTGASRFPQLAEAWNDGYAFVPDLQYAVGLRALLDGFDVFLDSTGIALSRSPVAVT